MRLAWFTPFSEHSMVARFSGMVTRELSRHADVDIWHPPAPSLRSTALRTIAMPRGVRVSPAMLDAYDLAVYNGGGEEADGGIAEAACAAPGLVILHGAVEAAERRAYAVIHAPTTFSPRKYAAYLLALAETVLPAWPILWCVDTMAGRLAEMGVEAGAEAVDRVAREACSLFGEERSSSRR